MKLLEGRLQVKEEERDSPTVQALKEIEYQPIKSKVSKLDGSCT